MRSAVANAETQERKREQLPKSAQPHVRARHVEPALQGALAHLRLEPLAEAQQKLHVEEPSQAEAVAEAPALEKPAKKAKAKKASKKKAAPAAKESKKAKNQWRSGLHCRMKIKL